jgi:O-antigen/teichoic acid export membrane protein
VLARELAARKDDPSASALLGNFLLVRAALGAVAAAAAVIVGLLLDRNDSSTLLLASVAAPLGAARFFDPVFQIFGQPWRGLPVALATSAVYTVSCVAALLWSNHPVPHLVIAYGLTGLVYVVIAERTSRGLIRPSIRVDRRMMREIMVMALPIGVATLFTAANGRIGVLLLDHMDSAAAVGSYAAAAKLIELGSVLVLTLAAPLIPVLVAAASRPDGLRSTAQCLFDILAIVTFPGVILTWYVAPWLLRHVFGAGYGAAEPVAAILVWQLILVPFSIVGSAVMVAAQSVRFSTWSAVLATIANTALNLWLIPRIGALATALGAITAEGIMFAVLFVFLWRRVGPVASAVTWIRIIAFNGVFVAILAHPIIDNDVANAVAALLLYTGLVMSAGIVPHRQLWSVFVRPAGEHP